MMGLTISLKKIILLCITIQSLCNAKVVVFFPIPAVSHVLYHTDMARAVSRMGHEAWVCIPDFLKGSQKIDVSGIKVLLYGETLGNLEQRLNEEIQIQKDFWEGETFSTYDNLRLLSFTIKVMDETLAEGLYEKVKRVKPVLFVVDFSHIMSCMLVVPYKLGIQFAFAGALHDVVNSRVPFSPVATPSVILNYSDQMTFWERFHTFLTYVIDFTFFRFVQVDTIAKYAPEKPHISPSDLASQAALYLAETDPILDYPRPMLPNTKLIGGAGVKDARPLKEPYKTFVESSKHGIVVVTFGSAILNVPDKISKKMMAAFDQLDLRIVWRVNATSPDKDKFLIDSWLPQNDLLGHPKTKLFVSHCGKNGQYEALYHAIPMLCLPVFADQFYNSKRIHAKGYGIEGDVREMTVDEMAGILQELISNSTYKFNVAKASRLFRLMYKSPMDEAAYWLDHVMIYGGDYMRASSQKMPLYQFLMLDIFAFLAFVAAFITFVLCFCVWVCCRSFHKDRSPKKKAE